MSKNRTAKAKRHHDNLWAQLYKPMPHIVEAERKARWEAKKARSAASMADLRRQVVETLKYEAREGSPGPMNTPTHQATSDSLMPTREAVKDQPRRGLGGPVERGGLRWKSTRGRG